MNAACTIVAHFQSIIMILSFGLQSFCPFHSPFPSRAHTSLGTIQPLKEQYISILHLGTFDNRHLSMNSIHFFILLNCRNSQNSWSGCLALLFQLLFLLLRTHKQIVGKKWQIDKCKFQRNIASTESNRSTAGEFCFLLELSRVSN